MVTIFSITNCTLLASGVTQEKNPNRLPLLACSLRPLRLFNIKISHNPKPTPSPFCARLTLLGLTATNHTQQKTHGHTKTAFSDHCLLRKLQNETNNLILCVWAGSQNLSRNSIVPSFRFCKCFCCQY